MAVTVTIALEDGKTVERTVDPATFSLGTLEDLEALQETGKVRDMVKGLQGILKLSRDEARQLTLSQVAEVMTAIKGAGTVNPESG